MEITFFVGKIPSKSQFEASVSLTQGVPYPPLMWTYPSSPAVWSSAWAGQLQAFSWDLTGFNHLK